jgi:hypothetical protein
MRRIGQPGILQPVDRRTVRVVVELDPGEPVCGSAGLEGETQVPFEGMLGFLALFDRLRARASDPDTRVQPSGS